MVLSVSCWKFSMDVVDDIQNYEMIPVYTVRRITRINNVKLASEAIEELITKT